MIGVVGSSLCQLAVVESSRLQSSMAPLTSFGIVGQDRRTSWTPHELDLVGIAVSLLVALTILVLAVFACACCSKNVKNDGDKRDDDNAQAASGGTDHRPNKLGQGQLNKLDISVEHRNVMERKGRKVPNRNSKRKKKYDPSTALDRRPNGHEKLVDKAIEGDQRPMAPSTPTASPTVEAEAERAHPKRDRLIRVKRILEDETKHGDPNLTNGEGTAANIDETGRVRKPLEKHRIAGDSQQHLDEKDPAREFGRKAPPKNDKSTTKKAHRKLEAVEVYQRGYGTRDARFKGKAAARSKEETTLRSITPRKASTSCRQNPSPAIAATSTTKVAASSQQPATMPMDPEMQPYEPPLPSECNEEFWLPPSLRGDLKRHSVSRHSPDFNDTQNLDHRQQQQRCAVKSIQPSLHRSVCSVSAVQDAEPQRIVVSMMPVGKEKGK